MSARTEILGAIKNELEEAGITCRFNGGGVPQMWGGEPTGLVISHGDICDTNKFTTMTVIGDELIINIYDHSQHVNCDKRKVILHDQSQLVQLVDELKRRYGTVA